MVGAMPTNNLLVSACMIVRNEEHFLEGCLESIREVVDEIVIGDTGSTDRTLEIASDFGVRLYHLPWKDDFSAARNQILEKAKGKYEGMGTTLVAAFIEENIVVAANTGDSRP